jgi:hypothetical protein
MTNAPQEITVEEIVQRLRDYLIGRVSQDEHEDDLDLAIDALEDAARRAVSQGETTIIPGSDYSKLYAAYYALIAERDKLTEEVERQVELIAHMSLDEEKLFKRVSELEVALKQIADPLLSPLLSRRDIARAALSRTSEEA